MTDRTQLMFGKPKSIISALRKKYGGKWDYLGDGTWKHSGKGYARNTAILGGFNGDDVVASALYYYPTDGKPERIEL